MYSILSIVVSVAIGGYVLTRLRCIPRWAMQGWFILLAIPFLTMARIGCELIEFFGRLAGVDPERRKDLCVLPFSGFMALWMKMSGHLDVVMDEDSRRVFRSIPLDESSVVLMNHTSFSDAILVSYFAPIGYLAGVRVMYMEKLARMALIGRCWTLGGHFPVHFKKYEDGAFSTDKEKQEKVSEAMRNHFRRGGRMALFPEGAINKTPEKLLPFRVGTFKMLKEEKVPIYLMAMSNTYKCWPPSAAIGGYPADIQMSMVKLDVDFNSEETAEELAARAQRVLQGQLDRLNGVTA